MHNGRHVYSVGESQHSEWLPISSTKLSVVIGRLLMDVAPSSRSRDPGSLSEEWEATRWHGTHA